jgi:hypothetical protein
MTAGPVPVAEPVPAAGTPPAAGTAPTARLAPDAAPAMPADRVSAAAPAGAAEHGVARRPVLIGLAVVAGAGLAGAGWELTRGGAPRPAASGVKRGRATSPAPQASAPRNTPAPHTGTKL